MLKCKGRMKRGVKQETFLAWSVKWEGGGIMGINHWDGELPQTEGM
jgi:hypothetical protein